MGSIKTRDRVLSVILAISLLFGMIMLFPCQNASAVAVVDDVVIGGTIAAWLGGLGISLSGTLDNDDTNSTAFISGLKNLSKQYDTFMNVADGFFWTNIQGLLSDVRMVSNTVDQMFIKVPLVAANALIGFTNWLKDEFTIVSNMTNAISLSTTTDLFLEDGSALPISSKTVSSASSGYNLGSQWSISFANGTSCSVVYENSTYTLTCPDGTILTQNDARLCPISYFYLNSGTFSYLELDFYYNTNVGRLRYFQHIGSHFTAASSVAELDGLGKDVLPDLDAVDENSDDNVYVRIPDAVVDSLPQDYTDSDVFGGVLDDAIAGTITNIGEDSYAVSIQDDAPLPSPTPESNNVDLPFVGISLPTTYSLGLSGIWHYVREWLSSIAGWFTWCRNVWSMLPSAMVVPIYASLVVVIVLGMYKRFFM